MHSGTVQAWFVWHLFWFCFCCSMPKIFLLICSFFPSSFSTKNQPYGVSLHVIPVANHPSLIRWRVRCASIGRIFFHVFDRSEINCVLPKAKQSTVFFLSSPSSSSTTSSCARWLDFIVVSCFRCIFHVSLKKSKRTLTSTKCYDQTVNLISKWYLLCIWKINHHN